MRRGNEDHEGTEQVKLVQYWPGLERWKVIGRLNGTTSWHYRIADRQKSPEFRRGRTGAGALQRLRIGRAVDSSFSRARRCRRQVPSRRC
jgi:hypothetical protein